MPQPKTFVALRNYMRGGDAYYTQNGRDDNVALAILTLKRNLLLLSPVVISIVMLKFPAFSLL
jgi:hypothetical protein